MKGFPQNICKLAQLMGRLKRRSDNRIKQDKIHFMLSLSYFASIHYSILREENSNEMNRQLKELRNVTDLVMCQDKCVLQSIEEYYGALTPSPKLTCVKLCPSCQGESARVIQRAVLIDHLEADVFDKGSVTLGIFSSKLLTKKGPIWVDKAVDIRASDAHEITILLWLNSIINIHWSGGDPK